MSKDFKEFRRFKGNKVVKCAVSQIDSNLVKPHRSGVILYTIYNNIIYFGLGLDSKTHELTDFAGGVYYNNNETSIIGGLREFKEETLDIFEQVTIDMIQDSLCIYDDKNMVIFIRIDLDPDQISQHFLIKYQKVRKHVLKCRRRKNVKKKDKYLPEVCSITWLTLKQLQYCLNHNKSTKSKDFKGSNDPKPIMFTRLSNFLNRSGNFVNFL